MQPDEQPNLRPDSDDSSECSATCTSENPIFADVLAGLRATPKALPCKYLYDERGSQLFDAICELDEYYLTRTETQIMCDNAPDMAQALGENVLLVEYGSGSSTKTRVLLEALLSPDAYVPVDISEEHLLATAEKLDSEFPALNIKPAVADFTKDFELPADVESDNVCVYFPGSTIGNLEEREAEELLLSVAKRCGENGKLLIGFDLQKDVRVLELAYDDPHGVTEAFSLNILNRLNKELDADFDVDAFKHTSFYNAERGRIEIYIESKENQTVTVCEERFDFEAGERMHTEYSHKYTVDGFSRMAAEAGLSCKRVWTDPKQYFAVMLLECC